MSLDPDAADALGDIADAIEKVQRFVAGMAYEDFAHDDKTSFAVIRGLEIIGEAAKQVPDSFRAQHPNVPWRDIEEAVG